MRTDFFIFVTFMVLLSGAVSLADALPAVDAVPPDLFPKARQPQVAVSPSGAIYLVFRRGNAVYCTSSHDTGKSFTQPVKVAEVGALALGMRRGPRVAATAKAVVVTAIGGRLGRGRDEDLFSWRSKDGGKTWKGPVAVNSVAGSAREGLHHTVAGPDGTIFSVWLDLREKRTEVYGSLSTDGGATWQNEKLIYRSPGGSVCECCQPQAAYDARGGLHVVWRNQLAGNRDMFLATSKDNGKSFGEAVKLGEGSWRLNACPMDGGGLAATADGQVTSIWMRDKELFRCVPGQPETSLGKGEQGWAACGPNGIHLVWIVARPGPVMAQSPGPGKPIRLAEHGADPVVAAPSNGKGPVVVAWEEGHANAMRIRVAVLNSPR